MKTTKSIQVSSELHAKVKEYCSKNGLKLQMFVEKLIKDGLSKSVRSDSGKSKEGA